MPIAGALARDVARHGIWRCVVIDAEHSTLLGLGRRGFRTGYTPSTSLDRYTAVRDTYCCLPSCHRRATQADHRTKYRDGGATCECNLQRLCTRHHRLKDNGYFTVITATDPHDPPGTLTWTTSHGYLIKRRPPTLDARAA